MWPINYDGTPATPSTQARKASYPPIPLIEGDAPIGEIATMEDQATLTSSYNTRAVRFIRENRGRSLGEVIRALDENGLTDRTLIIFISDNGPWKLVLPHGYRSCEEALSGKGGVPDDPCDKTTGCCLYDLRRDPGKRYDVGELYPEEMEELKQLADSARADLGDSLTGQNGSGRREPGRILAP